ncbi:MAG: hypothetical protein ACKO96_31845, partial [Flammeovirgaceae bacterium]
TYKHLRNFWRNIFSSLHAPFKELFRSVKRSLKITFHLLNANFLFSFEEKNASPEALLLTKIHLAEHGFAHAPPRTADPSAGFIVMPFAAFPSCSTLPFAFDGLTF